MKVFNSSAAQPVDFDCHLEGGQGMHFRVPSKVTRCVSAPIAYNPLGVHILGIFIFFIFFFSTLFYFYCTTSCYIPYIAKKNPQNKTLFQEFFFCGNHLLQVTAPLCGSWDGQEVRVEVVFEPECTGEVRDTLVLSSAEHGRYRCSLRGLCSPPLPQVCAAVCDAGGLGR